MVFLDHLANCSTIVDACREVGMSTTGAWALAQRDPEFARAQAEARAAGYFLMESMLVKRAVRRGRGYVPGDTQVPDPEQMDSELALNLLRIRAAGERGGSRRRGPKPAKASERELTEAILKQLDVLSRRRKRRK
ncbi:MAG TPA: hypothetical protein VF582_08455 [Allosphingosinicella sp.]|jgi:hypothetical protein